jgi:hypothetical protein
MSFKSILLPLLMSGLVVLALDRTSHAEDQSIGKHHEMKIGRLTYSFDAIPNPSGDPLSFTGRITVKGEKGETIYQEETALGPRCKMPIISKLIQKPLASSRLTIGIFTGKELELAILCGDTGGRHATLKIFFDGPVSLMSTTIEFEDTEPNLSDIDGDGFYEAKVYRRLLFDDVGHSQESYLKVYKLNIEQSAFGFSPAFGPKIAKPYRDYYLSLKKTYDDPKRRHEVGDDMKDFVGPMLAALLSTEDKTTICKGLKTFFSRGLTQNDLKTWVKRLTATGYPAFNLVACKEK